MRVIGFAIKLIFLLSFLISLAAGSLVTYSLHDTALVAEHQPPTPQQIKQLKDFIKANNPSKFKSGTKHTAAITENELNLFISHSLLRFNNRLRSAIHLFNDSAHITSSIELPDNPIGRYFNISAELKKSSNQISVHSLQFGALTVPDFIASLFLDFAHNKLSAEFVEYKYIINSATHFYIKNGRASIDYVWNPAVANQIKNRIASSIIPSDLRNRIAIYSRQLALVSRTISADRPSLTRLLKPMFNYALERSKSNNPVNENQALFITLGAHMLGKNIPQLLGNRSVEHIPQHNYYLLGRNDLSKHFLISAALTAAADPAMAQAIGLEKEIDDSAGGSGFSFADLAADRAGVALARASLASTEQAALMQKQLAAADNENDFMPGINSLQEGLQEIDFRKIYQHTNSEAYKTMISLIDQRIALRPVYQN